MTTATVQTLADFPALFVRCSGCTDELPQFSKVATFQSLNSGGMWLVIECPRCHRNTPHKVEAA